MVLIYFVIPIIDFALIAAILTWLRCPDSGQRCTCVWTGISLPCVAELLREWVRGKP